MARNKQITALILLTISALVAVSALLPLRANAVTGSQWLADRIIDDGIFFDGKNMSQESIQAFLNAKVPNCDTNGQVIKTGSQTRAQWAAANGKPTPPYTCLKSYSQTIPGKAADAFCQGAVGSGTKSAAQIIYEVSVACSISPKVLLVTLQKEQSLITDDWPWPIQYTKATGYGCPDSDLGANVDANDNGCYDEHEGFFNQIYMAARQFQRYKIQANLFNHRSQQTSYVGYNPNGDCGGTNITMYNHATAGLYNYTPYQPNTAALNNLYGTGNSCSAYGNRNFWRMFHDWFGDPHYNPTNDIVFVGDWDGDGDDTAGIRRGNTYFLDNNNDGVADIQFGFGLSTDTHLVGDWDGDGGDEIGLKRGERYYLDYNFDGGAEIYQAFGDPGDQTIIGDWDGDDKDEIGLKRGSRFYLSFDYDGKADLYVGFGNPTDSVFIGDWDGDGDDNLAIRRTDWYFFDYGHDGEADARFGYGSSAHKVIVGDWDGDGIDTMGLKRGEFYYLDNNLDGETEVFGGIGIGSDKSLIGDWNGDGKDTVSVKRSNYYFLDNTTDGGAEIVYFYTY